MTKVGMNTEICASIRGKTHPGERCTAKAKAGAEWCGKHSSTQVRFAPATVEHIAPSPPRFDTSLTHGLAAKKIRRAWSSWLARRAGPLLRIREESNNPFDFFSADPVAEIPIGDVVSFVSEGKGYIMDIKSAVSLIEHAGAGAPENPFNRTPLPALFLKRVGLHSAGKAKKTSWATLQPMSDEQKNALATTDVFSLIEDLGYYTDPGWFMDLDRVDLQRFYIELADIWNHRATLTPQDRVRIVPAGGRALSVPVSTAMIMQQKALRPLLLKTCKTLVSTAAARSDKQLGVMYVLGALSLVSPGAGTAYPWLTDMFSPGVTRIHNGHLQVLHGSVMTY